jgi:glycosyltransferase involved in cell wall biosynthesis
VEHLHTAAYAVAPSTGVESFGLVAIEAFSCGTPVIGTRHGGLAELVEHGKTGLLVTPGDVDELAHAIAWAETNPAAMRQMGQAARAKYLARYTPEHNYEILLEIYGEAISEGKIRRLSKTNLDGERCAENCAGG